MTEESKSTLMYCVKPVTLLSLYSENQTPLVFGYTLRDQITDCLSISFGI